jgi:6,7-dimethyl-8-ribityllumazine synthase
VTLRILIVEARFYGELADGLLASARETLEDAGCEVQVVSVPGALEIPAAIAIAEEAGRLPVGVHFDGYVALGAVIRGETYHFEVVADRSSQGLTDLGLRGLAIGNGVLTVENEAQARARLDKGAGAAEACLALIALKHQLRGGRG